MESRSRSWTTRWARGWALAFVFAAGCVVTPVPEPPNIAPSLVRIEASGTSQYQLVGEPGAATAGVLWLANVDRSDPATEVDVDPDGRFVAPFLAERADEIRFQVRRGALRSPPLDAPVVEGTIAITPTSLLCFVVEPGLELDVESAAVGTVTTRSIAVENRCGIDLTVASARMRRGSEGFTVVDAPTVLLAISTAEIRVEFTPVVFGAVDDVLRIEVTDSTLVDRRSVTLFGRGE